MFFPYLDVLPMCPGEVLSFVCGLVWIHATAEFLAV